jgi:hypothetical protein
MMSSKTLFALGAMMLALPAAASAQLATGQVNVSATVEAYAAITGSGDVAFGNLSRTVDNVINAAGGPGSAQRVVTFNGNIDVAFTSVPATLSGPNGSTLAVTLDCAYDEGSGWTAPAACSSLVLPFDNTGTGLSSVTLGFGGDIAAAAVQLVPAGAYSGSFTITVTAR